MLLSATVVMVASVFVPVWAAAADADSFSAAIDSIQDRALRNHTNVLASDTFEGREAGSRGGRAAGAYLITQLRKLGIKGGGSGGGHIQEFGTGYRNILSVLPGSGPELKKEYVVIGAHYDHVGYGSSRNSRGPIGRIHNGADDNASGTAGLLEIIEACTKLSPAPKRSLLFVFWDGEEQGLLGSSHWVQNPTVPLKQIRFCLNMDMIGRLRKNSLEVYGIRTAPGLRRLISEQNRGSDLTFEYNWDLKKDSDHYPFAARRIPVLMLHTKKHDDYHRPSDDPHKLNIGGMQRIAQLAFRIAYAAADGDSLGKFRPAAFRENAGLQRRLNAPAAAMAARLGAAWGRKLDEQQIIKLTRVSPGTPAEKAGLKVGDRIVQFGRFRPGDAADFRTIVLAAENPVAVIVEREGSGKPVTLSVQLDGSPLRLGINWRVDTAEPGCVILTRVIPGSPADLAGIRAGDRVHSVGGEEFRTSDEFHKLVTGPADSLEFVTERRGILRTGTTKLLPRLETDG